MNRENYDQYESKNMSNIDLEKNNPGLPARKDLAGDQDQTGVPNQVNSTQGQNQIPVVNNDLPIFQDSKLETLDESVWETMKRDLKKVIYKLEHVLLPRFSASRGKDIQNWDLLGPLLICLILCTTVASSGDKDFEAKGAVFIIIFVIVWLGGFIISLNSQFLGAKINYFQSICLLGYCIFPIDIAAIIIRTVSSAKFVKLIVVGAALIWSCISSVGFMSGIVQPEKKMVAVYPVFLFFLVLSWFVLDL